MAYIPSEMAIRATEDQPYGQGAADLAATRERQQAAQQTGKPEAAAPPPAMTSRGRGSGAINPGRMADPTANDVPKQEPPDWPADVALRQHDTPPSGAELGVTASQARRYLLSRPTRQYGGHPEQTSLADPTTKKAAGWDPLGLIHPSGTQTGKVIQSAVDSLSVTPEKVIADPVLGWLARVGAKDQQDVSTHARALALVLGLVGGGEGEAASAGGSLKKMFDDPAVQTEIGRLQSIALRLKSVPGMEKDAAEIDSQLAALQKRFEGLAAADVSAGVERSKPGMFDQFSQSNDVQVGAKPGQERFTFQKSNRQGTQWEVWDNDPSGQKLKGTFRSPEEAQAKVNELKQAALPAGSTAGKVGGGAAPDAAQLAREADIKAGKVTPSDEIPGERQPPTPGRVQKTTEPFNAKTALQAEASKGRTPFESPTVAKGGVTRAEAATPPIVYPSEENLGIPKGLMDSLPQNLKDIVVDEARANYDAIQQARGGVVPPSAVDIEAQSILVDAGVLAQARPRMPVTAPGMIALQRAIMRVSEERMAIEAEAAALGPDGVSDQLRARFAVKVFEQNSLQRVVAGARAEWGRVGQAMQAAIKSGDEVRLRNVYNEIIRAVGKDNIDGMMERLQAIRTDPNLIGDPYRRQVAEFKFVQQLTNATNWQKLDEVFYNAVLSIPHTHMGIVLGQMLFSEAEAVASLGGAAINAVASAATLGRIPYEQTITKALGEAIGTHMGIASGLNAARVFLRTGIKRDELAQFVESGRLSRGHALQNVKVKGVTVAPIASVINTPTTLIDTYTVAFHEMGRQKSLVGQAFETAQKEGLGSVFSSKFRDRVAALLADPSAELNVQAARDAGRRASLRGQPANALATKMREIRDLEIPSTTPLVGRPLGGMAPGRRVIPFVNIAFNLASIGVEYSPVGFIRVLNPANQLGAGARSVAAARAAMGSLLFKHLWDKAGQGELTGPLPTDPNERAQWNREGKQAYSYRLGNQWIPFDRILGPMATPARWVTGMQAAFAEAQGKPLDAALVAETGAKMIWAMGEAFGDTTFMIGPDQIIQAGAAISKGDIVGGLGNYAGQQAVSQMPFSGFLKSWAQSVDPLVRSVKGFIAQLESALPGLSTNLPSVQDAYGQPVTRQPQEQGISGVVNPIRATTDLLDPVDKELSSHSLPAIAGPDGQPLPQKQLFASMAAKEVASFSLTSEEGALVQTLAGRATHQALTELFASAAYKAMSNAAQTKAITKAITEARAAARSATADAILQKATTSAEVTRAADMRISLLSARYERAQFLAGLSKSGKLTPAAKAGIDTMLATKYKGQPTVSEYLKVAPLLAQYLAAPPFDRGTQAEWTALAAAKTKESELASRDRVDGTKTAQAFLLTPEGRIIAQYNGVPKGRDRTALEARNPTLVPYLGGTTYVQVR